MRLYFSFGYNFKKLGISFFLGEEDLPDLVGLGFDNPPTLRYLEIHILFFSITVGNLYLNKE